MALTILNSISAQTAENALSRTQVSLQRTLTQLSTGLRINSGSDDAAGLSIASGMTANIAALTQSQQNANNGVGMLQTADGALSQVNTLLNRAVTLATESANGGLTGGQRSASNAEYQSILAEIDQIGSTTNFNGAGVFGNGTVSMVALADSGTIITGPVDPTATLSGSVTVIANPSYPTTEPVYPVSFTTASDGSSVSSSVITTGDTLNGSVTITTIPTPPDPVTFTATADGSSISSSAITAGDTLTGSLVINSSGGMASYSYSLSLANYQGLASSDSATATTAANQLAIVLTSAMGSTGATYSASISGGVLTIHSTPPAPSPPSPVDVPFDSNYPWALMAEPFDAGATLAGSLNFTSSLGGGPQSIDFANYQGLTSQNPSVQSDALAKLGIELTARLGSATGQTYAAHTNGGEFIIFSNDTSEQYQVNASSDVTQTDVLGTQNLSVVDYPNGIAIYTPNRVPAGARLSGTLRISSTSSHGTGTVSIDLDNYPDLLGTDANAPYVRASLESAINTALSLTNGTYAVFSSVGGGSLTISREQSFAYITDNGSTLQFTPGESLSVGSASNVQQRPLGAPLSTSTTLNLNGLTSANLASSLLSQLGGASGDYSVNYDTTSQALSIGISSAATIAGIVAIVSSASNVQQSNLSGPLRTSTTLNLNGLTFTSLASSLLSQLGGAGGNYTVSYGSGALSIGISSTGTTANIAAIVSSANSVQEALPPRPDNIFTSDGSGSGNQTLNVTVGVLSSASVGTTTGGAGQDLSATDLNSSANAAAALTKITSAINDISNQRGAVGANVNRLMATVSVMGTELTNLQSAVNNIQNADIGTTVASMTQYNILQATGMAALQQSNQAQQAVLKLVQ